MGKIGAYTEIRVNTGSIKMCHFPLINHKYEVNQEERFYILFYFDSILYITDYRGIYKPYEA